MAKRSILGVMTGKLGNMVGQSNSLVSSKDKQVWRVYNGNVKNPKTIRQAAQRSLFVAAKNFQQAFAEILDHSWQGVDYGTKSLNHFRSMVLANGGANFPGFFYQPKGAQNFIPQPWPISRGSININTNLEVADPYEFYNRHWVVKGYGEGNVPTTAGQLWTDFLSLNPAFVDGDMITILIFASSVEDFSKPLIPLYGRVIIDTTSTEAVADGVIKFNGAPIAMTLGSAGIANSDVVFTPDENTEIAIYAAGVIVSRQNGTKASWLRSKSNLFISTVPNVAAKYGSDEYITACLDSFMNSDAAAESDWYLNQTGENEEEGGTVGPDPTPVQISVESREAALTPEGSVNAAYVLNGSQSGYLVYGGKYFALIGTELTARSFAAGTDFAESVVRLILTETLQAKIEAAGYSFSFPVDPDEP